jgi:hypothetical protein
MATSARNENYCVYITFDAAVTTLLNGVRDALQHEHADCLAYTVREDAHCTVLYGPLLPAGTPECSVPVDLLGPDVTNRVWEACKQDVAAARDIYYQGVSCFDRRVRDGKIIVKVELATELGTALRVAAWKSMPDMETRRATEEAALRAAGDTEDATYNQAKPLRWAHATLAVLDASKTTAEALLAIQEQARNLLARAGMPARFEMADCALMTAVSWTPLSLLQ